jgi:hypothetical protein
MAESVGNVLFQASLAQHGKKVLRSRISPASSTAPLRHLSKVVL